MANRVWKNEASEKGRIVRRPSKFAITTAAATKSEDAPKINKKFTDSQILDLFGWGKNSSIWANPCNFSQLKDFQGATEADITERVGFLCWDLASKKTDVKIVTYDDKQSGSSPKQFYSICGYMPLMPHLHNFSNVSNMIQDLESFLIEDLIFHLFGKMQKSLKDISVYDLNAYGYTIRFDELTVTSQDNDPNADDADIKNALPTNRVARAKIYGAILVDKDQVDNAAGAALSELRLDPKKEPPVERKIIPDPTVPDYSREELSEIEKIPKPVGQFGLSPEATRREQLKLYSIAQLKSNPDLPIPNPDDAYFQKLEKYKSILPEEKIYECLELSPVGDIIFFDQANNTNFPAEEQLDGTNLEKLTKEGMFFMPILTDINYEVHEDPEKLFYDLEHDETIKRLVRDIYFNSLQEPEVLGDYIDEDETEREVLKPAIRLPKMPDSLNLISLADDIGYLRTEYITNAKYGSGKKVDTWIMVVGIKYSKLLKAKTYDFPHPDDEQAGPELFMSKPDNIYDWLPRLGQDPWRVVQPEKVVKYSIKGQNLKKNRKGKTIQTSTTELRRYWYYAYETDYEYHRVHYDPVLEDYVRNRAVAALYDRLSPAREMDYRTADYKLTRIPQTGKAAMLVSVREEWAKGQPIKKGSKPTKIPKYVTMPQLANGPGPFINWMKTTRPFPTWFDMDRDFHYTIIESDESDKYVNDDSSGYDLDLAKTELGTMGYEEILIYNGKEPTPNPSVDARSYYKYFSERQIPSVVSEIWLDPKPISAPRVIVGIDNDFLEKLPEQNTTLSDAQIEDINFDFQKDRYLILKLPMAGPGSKDWEKFRSRLKVAARVLRDQGKAMGPRKNAPNGLTQRELYTAARQIDRFMDDFWRLVMTKNNVRIRSGSDAVINNLDEQNACEFYLYLDPQDYSLIDVFAFGKTRLNKGVSDFKKLWSPPQSLAMQFVFWSGMTYINTAQGRDDKFDFFDMMSILLDPFGAFTGWLGGLDIPGFPKGFTGKLLANSVASLKNPPTPLFGPGGEHEAWLQREKDRQAIEEARHQLSLKYAGNPMFDGNPDTFNPSVVDEDPSTFMAQLSAAGCGEDLFANILAKVNIFDLIMMYLKCLGIELPIDPRCLFNFPWPLFSLRFNIPKFSIPDISWADIWEIIRKIIFELICQLIIQLLMTLIKEILNAVMALAGCENPDEPWPAMPDAPMDFDDPDKSPTDMINDALKGAPKGPFDSNNAEDFAKDMFGVCQPGMHLDQYGEGRGPLNYFEDVAAILSTVEFCKLMHGEPTNDSLDRVIRFTKREYPDIYYQGEPNLRASKVGKKKSKKGSNREPDLPEKKRQSDRTYIGFPRPPGVPSAYKNFFLCIADHLGKQVNDLCKPEALTEKYGRPTLNQLANDKCTLEDLEAAAGSLNDKLRKGLKDKGLSDEQIEEQIKKADAEIAKKLTDLDAIQAAIDDFMDVVIPKITAPAVKAVEMNAFDGIFKSVRQQFAVGISSVGKDARDANSDLSMLVNYVVNAKNVTTSVAQRRRTHLYFDRHWRLRKRVRYRNRYYIVNQEPQDPFWIMPDPIFLDPKFKVRTQTFPNPDWWRWFQKMITKSPWPLPGYQHQMLIPESMQRLYCSIGYPPRLSYFGSLMASAFSGNGTAGWDAEDLEALRERQPEGLAWHRWRDWEVPRWYRRQKNKKFINEGMRDVGNLADVTPKFRQGKKNKNDGISEELIIGNEKFKFSVTLDKDGENFYYQIWKEPYETRQFVPIPLEERVVGGPTTRIENIKIPRENVFPEPVKVDLSEKIWDPNEQKYYSKYPWWHDRRVKKNKSGWIQRDEFIERFIVKDHPLRSTSSWKSIASDLFQNVHDGFYVPYVEQSIVEVLRRNPMKDFWLEEYYKAENYPDLQQNWLTDEDLLTRNRLTDPEDPYYKLNDIKAVAKTILKGDVSEALQLADLVGGKD